MRKHWYKFFIGECPVCGSEQSYKVRQYSEKPVDIKDRYIYLDNFETYDHCMD